MTTENKDVGKPLIGYVVIDDYTDDMSNWSGAIAFPNPVGANLFWENPKPFIEKSVYDTALARIAELEALCETMASALENYKQWDKYITGWNPISQCIAHRDIALEKFKALKGEGK